MAGYPFFLQRQAAVGRAHTHWHDEKEARRLWMQLSSGLQPECDKRQVWM